MSVVPLVPNTQPLTGSCAIATPPAIGFRFVIAFAVPFILLPQKVLLLIPKLSLFALEGVRDNGSPPLPIMPIMQLSDYSLSVNLCNPDKNRPRDNRKSYRTVHKASFFLFAILKRRPRLA
jgi:hypothetical protein